MFHPKVVEEIKTHVLCSVTFSFPKIVLFMRKCGKNIVQHCRPHITTWRMRIACWIPNATNTHSGCVMLTAIQQQQWLHGRVSTLRYTHIGCLVLFSVGKIPGYVTVLICSAISLLLAAVTLTVSHRLENTSHPLISPESNVSPFGTVSKLLAG